MLTKLKEDILKQNLALVEHGLVIFTWGNVSGIDRKHGLVVIKPSGVPYAELTVDDLSVVDLDGNLIEGKNPSSDTATHLALYKAFPTVGGIVHTHSTYATAFAQAGRPIPALGTTQGDDFYGDIPVTRGMTDAEIGGEYEKETGNVIIETFRKAELDPLRMPGVLVRNHGPFAWGATPAAALHNAVVLEEAAHMDLCALLLDPEAPRAPQALLDRHFFRKHGENATYGQR